MKTKLNLTTGVQCMATLFHSRLRLFIIGSAFVCWGWYHQTVPLVSLWAQEKEPTGPVSTPLSPEELEAVSNPSDGDSSVAQDDHSHASDQADSLNLFQLILRGRWLMIPIGIMSFVVVAVTYDRFIALRQYRVFPTVLVDQLGQLGQEAGGFDPRKAYHICQRHPSAAATIVRTMLLKVGRPQSEIEHAVREASDREAERLYANVRWLNLAAAVTPLLGLLGTVWGMIQAFFDTTQLAPTQNKADFLAEGIYVALVTTLGGLSVAIPAAILAHYFEGRIQTVFHRIDEMLFNLLPQVERYEGRMRVTHQPMDGEQPSQLVTPHQEPSHE